jgi:hypothetical protein
MTLKEMELKRYVLWKFNSKKSILTKKSFEEQYEVDNWVAETGFIRTSDNMLDLVEEGDLFIFDRKDGTKHICYISKIRSQINGRLEYNLFNYIELTEDVLTFNKSMYLYKLQPNGDYKKYDIKN